MDDELKKKLDLFIELEAYNHLTNAFALDAENAVLFELLSMIEDGGIADGEHKKVVKTLKQELCELSVMLRGIIDSNKRFVNSLTNKE